VTGALEPLARLLGAAVGRSTAPLAMLALLASAMILSAFINDTPVVVVLMPVVIGLAMRAGQSASPMLMPMNFAVIIGAWRRRSAPSTNLLIVSLARDYGVAHIDMFEFSTWRGRAAPLHHHLVPGPAPRCSTGPARARATDVQDAFEAAGVMSARGLLRPASSRGATPQVEHSHCRAARHQRRELEHVDVRNAVVAGQ